jgi:2-methylcitrate dehydratase PrpD
VSSLFSLPFLLAVAAVRRGLRVPDLTTDTQSDPRVLALAHKVVTVRDPARSSPAPQQPSGWGGAAPGSG